MWDVHESAVDPRLTRRRSVEIEVRLLRVRVVVARPSSAGPATRLFALHEGRPVGYATFHPGGRVSFPWCRRGHEGLADALLGHVLEAMKARGIRRAFAAYRADWPAQRDFFLRHGQFARVNCGGLRGERLLEFCLQQLIVSSQLSDLLQQRRWPRVREGADHDVGADIGVGPKKLACFGGRGRDPQRADAPERPVAAGVRG